MIRGTVTGWAKDARGNKVTEHACKAAWTSQGYRGGRTVTLTIVREDGKELRLLFGFEEAEGLHGQLEFSLQGLRSK